MNLIELAKTKRFLEELDHSEVVHGQYDNITQNPVFYLNSIHIDYCHLFTRTKEWECDDIYILKFHFNEKARCFKEFINCEKNLESYTSVRPLFKKISFALLSSPEALKQLLQRACIKRRRSCATKTKMIKAVIRIFQHDRTPLNCLISGPSKNG